VYCIGWNHRYSSYQLSRENFGLFLNGKDCPVLRLQHAHWANEPFDSLKKREKSATSSQLIRPSTAFP
jgi:hypothetical protein